MADASQPKLRVLMGGSGGLIGSAVAPLLESQGHEVHHLVRRPPVAAREHEWHPERGQLTLDVLRPFDVVVQLGGVSIASGRWTRRRREAILTSRVESVNLLAASLAALDGGPRVLLTASAAGYYGSRGGERLTESSASGDGFLAGVCRAWEAAAGPARAAGLRVVHARFGLVMSPTGGAMRRLMPLFRLGLGGKLGNGAQYWSWIDLEDAAAALAHVLARPELSGPINVVGPAPVTNAEFTRALAGALHRPAPLPVPAALLRLALGRMADELLLASQRVLPERLLESGFQFRCPTLDAAVGHLIA